MHLLAGILSSSIVGTASAQSVSPGEAARSAIIERIGAMLIERYVFPEVAATCAEHLRAQRDAGALDGDSDDPATPEAFAARLTEALRTVSKDKHMLVRVVAAPSESAGQKSPPQTPLRAWAQRMARDRQQNFGFEKVEHLDGNVGYVDLRFFSGAPDARATAAAAMAFLAGSDALIFDLRRNGGGNPDMVRVLSSYLFDEPTHLNSLYFRDGDRTEEFWTLDEVPGQKMPDVPVFVLTSADTFSGAEEFSYNLRVLERATLVGETTRGGANPGGVFPIDAQFEMIIPTGRAINPITGTNWEGTGVEPHVAVAANLALETALPLAQAAAAAHQARNSQGWDALDAAHTAAVALDEASRGEEAALVLSDALRAAHDGGLVGELHINMIGYELLGQGRPTLAIAAFTVNVERYPASANTYDSLAEASMSAGDVDGAIRNYERSIELAPAGPGAKSARATLTELRSRSSSRP